MEQSQSRDIGEPKVFISFLHLDDGADCEHDLNTARFAAESTRSNLAEDGIVANRSKSVWIPTHAMDWLGFIWNRREEFLAIIQVRLEKLLD